MEAMRFSCCFFLSIVAAALCALPADEPIAESPISESDREHWAFQAIRRPKVPVTRVDATGTSLDPFILARLEKKGLSLAPAADRATLLRRLSFDLIGLPPTPDETAAFANDRSPDAYARQVDRLLASPGYGERWAQHWLDLARFADTDGFEHDLVRPNAWKYRDWVIAALNDDMPYDEFVRLQLAGDELAVEGGEIATTFCLAGPDMLDINDQAERRHNVLNELTGAVGSVLLGLQLGCAQCHDHKYDPISQADFYRLRAVFEPSVPSLKRDVAYNTLKTQEDAPAARFWIRGDHRRPSGEVMPGFPRIASAGDQWRATSDSGQLRRELADWLFRDDNPLTARVIVNRLWQHHFDRAIFETSSDAGLMGTSPSHEDLLDYLACELREHGWSLKYLHRLIVCSATYRQASRGSGDVWQQALTLDPENSLYSRFPRRRLEGETLRDALLASAGLLNTERGGPGVMPPLPKELVDTLLKGQWTESPRQADHYRRSVYLFARRNLRYPLFEAFDRPDANASCPVRSRSTTAPQSLVLFNSELSLLTARHLAGRVMRDTGHPQGQIESLYWQALSRRPDEKEAATLASFLAEERQRLASEGRPRKKLALPLKCPADVDPYAAAALVDACLGILNTNEFLYVD
jgi:hypothetical protein